MKLNPLKTNIADDVPMVSPCRCRDTECLSKEERASVYFVEIPMHLNVDAADVTPQVDHIVLLPIKSSRFSILISQTRPDEGESTYRVLDP